MIPSWRLAACLAVIVAPGAAATGAVPDSVNALVRRNEMGAAEALAREWRASLTASQVADSLLARADDLLVFVLLRTGKWSNPESEEIARSAVALKERAYGPDAVETAQSLRQLAFLLYRAVKLDAALEPGRRSLALYERARGPSDPSLIACLHALANIEEALGDFGSAREHYVRWRDIAEAGTDSVEIANAHNSLCIFYRKVGEYVEARRSCDRSLALKRERLGPDNPDMAPSWLSLGNLQTEMGDEEGALVSYTEVVRVADASFPADHPFRALGRNALGGLLYHLGDFEGAQRTLEEGLAIYEHAFGPNAPQSVPLLANLSDVLADLGNDEAARRYGERALAIRRKAFGEESLDVARSLLGLGRTALLAGRLAEATDLLDRALAIRQGRLPDSHPDVAEAMSLLAFALAASGRDERARSLAVDAGLRRADHLRRVSRFAEESASLTYVTSRQRELDRVLSVFTSFGALKPADVEELWDVVIRSRAIVLDELAARSRRIGDSSDPEVAKRARALLDQRAALAHLLLQGLGSTPAEELRTLVEGATARCNEVERSLAEVSACFQDERAVQAAGYAEVARALPDRTMLVAFLEFVLQASPKDLARPRRGREARETTRYAAFCLSRGQAPRLVLLGDGAVLDETVRAWRAAVTHRPGVLRRAEDERAAAEAGVALRKAAWDPLEVDTSAFDRVLIVPDGAINLVNFAALPSDGGEFLAEASPPFHVVSAERDLVLPASCGGRSEGLVAFGDPAFGPVRSEAPTALLASARAGEPAPADGADCGDPALFDLVPLPASAAEIDAVARIWRQRDSAAGRKKAKPVVRLERDATETALRDLAPDHRVVHLATHAFYLESPCVKRVVANPLLRTGFALAGANASRIRSANGEDGVMTAQEVAGLDLHGAEWAVLSGCTTAGGELVSGEGVLGLRRAFQIAGAGTIIMSLWPVDDEATGRWMATLYREKWLEQHDTATAIHDAYRETLAERRQRGQSVHPYYWAAFVGAGDWR